MQKVGTKLLQHLRQPPYRPLDLRWLVEVYDGSTNPDVLCSYTTSAGPAQALAHWTYGQCVTWNGQLYRPRLAGDPPTINRFFGRELNNASFSLKNLDLYGTRWVLGQRVEGLYVVVRLVSPQAETDYAILFVGRFERPGVIGTLTAELSARQFYGGLEREAPFRAFGPQCPLDFGKTECLGNQTLAQKSVLFQQAYSSLGEAGCNKSYQRCKELQNLNYYQGIKLFAVSGSYRFVEKVKTRFLFFFSRTKKVTKTIQYTSSENVDLDRKVPLAWGRVALGPLHVMQSAELANTVIASAGIADGEQTALLKVTSHDSNYPVQAVDFHPGAYGGEAGQLSETRFPDSPPLARLCYAGITYGGATPENSDSLPETSAIILARKMKSPDTSNTLAYGPTSDNPVWVVRDILTAPRLGNLPECLVNDSVAFVTARACNEIVIDASGSNLSIDPALPDDAPSPTRLRITSKIQSLENGPDISLLSPGVANQEPELAAASVTPPQILRRRFTFNGVLSESAKLTDFLQKSVLPVARLYLITGADGKVEIRQENKVANCFLREGTQSNTNTLPVTNVLPWVELFAKGGESGWLLVGTGTAQAELARVSGVTWSDSQNSVSVTAEAQGGITATLSATTLSGGSLAQPAQVRLALGGTAAAGASVRVVLDGVTVTAYPQAGDSGRKLTSLVAGWLNAHPVLQLQYSADWNDTGVTITALAGHLVLDRQLSKAHSVGDECLRADYVFSNCDTAGVPSNILRDSFKWNSAAPQGGSTGYNAVRGTFTSAVNGFARWEVVRKARPHIDETGVENALEMDLHAIDNYAQAIDVLRGKLLQLRDCDLYLDWSSAAGESLLLEEGDVVIVQYRTFGADIPAMPVRLRQVQFGPSKSDFKGQLYKSSAYTYPGLAQADLPQTSTVTTPANELGSGSNANGDGFANSLDCARYVPGGDNFYGTGVATTDDCGRDLS